MIDYTPTTEQVKDLFHLGALDMQRTTPDVDVEATLAMFDRWLNSVKADAWSEGWHDCGDTSLHYTDNPYLTEGTN